MARKHNFVPVWQDVSSDIFTPVEVFLSLAKRGNRPSYLFESVEQGEGIARYSFLGTDPVLEVVVSGEDPRPALRQALASVRPAPIDGAYPLELGLVGYVAYDVVRFFEPVRLRGQSEVPEVYFFLPRIQVAFDHREQRVRFVVWVPTAGLDRRRLEEAYDSARRRLEALIAGVGKTAKTLSPIDWEELRQIRKKVRGEFRGVRSSFSRRRFVDAVEKAKAYIRDGEIIQVVLSQRFELTTSASPFDVYRVLRILNPSPYMFYLSLPRYRLHLVGSSPEMLVRVSGGRVETHPIAGTRRRGRDAEEDARLAEELLADEKERAEHVMLVDLGRNDLGRVCVPGTVKVKDFMRVENYSHVMHIVSRVYGELQRGKDAIDVLSATFPAGTVSGAPKIRAMEIIEELEPIPRGIYAGAVGYLDFKGDMDLCIAIRTIVFYNDKSYIQAGAGVVADSVPELEYLETQNKARAQILAVRFAESIGR